MSPENKKRYLKRFRRWFLTAPVFETLVVWAIAIPVWVVGLLPAPWHTGRQRRSLRSATPAPHPTSAPSTSTSDGSRPVVASRAEALRQEMMRKSGRTTFPQIFIGGKHVGGCDDLFALEQAGKLDRMLAGEA